MSGIQYNLIESQDGATLSVYVEGELHTIDSSHINFEEIVANLRSSSPNSSKIKNLIDIRNSILVAYKQLTELVEVRDDQIFFDNELADPVISESIIKSLSEERQEDKARAMALFLENLSQNPSSDSKQQLYSWLRDRNFSITEEGMIVGYKGLRSDFTSVFSGGGFVDGKEINGHLPNNPGSTVSMARSEVTFDPAVGCAYGLHVGTFSYASMWANNRDGKLVTVLVNPRDVVSVPHDCASEKMRVSRYKVVREVSEPINDLFLLSDPMEQEEKEDYNYYTDWEDDYYADIDYFRH